MLISVSGIMAETTIHPSTSKQSPEQRPLYAGNAVLNAKVPYSLKLDKFNPGDILIISGYIPSSCRNFSVNFQEMSSRPVDTILLHVDVRVYAGVIVCNNKTPSGWQTEERFDGFNCGLSSDRPFECMIMLHRDFFKVAFNGRHLYNFEHRSPYSQMTHAHIEGGVQLNSVHIQHGPLSTQYSDKYMPALPATTEEKQSSDGAVSRKKDFLIAYDVKLPYIENIPGGMKPGRVVYVSLIPTGRNEQFAINLKPGPGSSHSTFDYALHFKVMMKERMIVLNTRETKWGKEQQIRDRFPFRTGVHYDIAILCEDQQYRVSVNNQHFTDYKHRLKQLSGISVLDITGAAKVVHVRVF